MFIPTPLLQIPHVTATQVVREEVRVRLQTGTLTVLPPPTADTSLLFTISPTLAFPLSRSNSSVAVSATNPNLYLFHCVAGNIELTLPNNVDPALALRLEEILVEHGFLSTGLAADADDVAGTLRDAAARTAARIGGYAKQRVENREEVEPEEAALFSDRMKGAMEATVEGTGKATEVTGKLGRAVESAAESIGKWIGGMMPKQENGAEEGVVKGSFKGAAEGATVLGGGVAESVKTVSNAVGEGASAVVAHEHGPEAKEMVDEARTVAGNVGSVAMDVVADTSVAKVAIEAAGKTSRE
jgi:hypothetical protein